MKNILIVFYTVIRFFSLIIILLLAAIFINFLWHEFNRFDSMKSSTPPEKTVCGKISGQTVEIVREYFFFWPSYEGSNDWDPDAKPVKKGCDANLIYITIEANWPGMTPAGNTTIDSNKPGHISFSVEPLSQSNDGKLAQRFLDSALEDLGIKQDEQINFDSALGLFYASGREGGDTTKKVYWHERDGSTVMFIECSDFDKSEITQCEQRWYFRALNSSIDLSYMDNMLPNWKSMQMDIENFVANSYKNTQEE